MENLEKIQKLIKKFSCERDQDGTVCFDFEITESALVLFSECEVEGVEFNYQVGTVYEELGLLSNHIGKQAKAQLQSVIRSIYWDWDEFLAYKPNLKTVPTSFLLVNDNTYFPRDQEKPKVKHYLDICTLINILANNADHINGINDTVVLGVVFLHKSRLEIPTVYSQESLGDGLDGISIISSLISDQSHKEQKTSILKETLYGLLSNIPKRDRFTYLLSNFGEFSKRTSENYQLFVSEFSFDDVRKEYEEKRRDYFTKLNDVFTSVQVKMLGIPISLALASFKMSTIVDEVSFWTNFLLALSVCIYVWMMIMLIKNQKHTLTSIKSEYQSQMNRLKHQYADQYDQIKGIESELNARYSYQKTCLNWFYAMTGVLFILIIALFLRNLPWLLILGISHQ